MSRLGNLWCTENLDWLTLRDPIANLPLYISRPSIALYLHTPLQTHRFLASIFQVGARAAAVNVDLRSGSNSAGSRVSLHVCLCECLYELATTPAGLLSSYYIIITM